ncbi:MAG: O-antigen ligase family protein [Hyphomicrobiaceae bacterium]
MVAALGVLGIALYFSQAYLYFFSVGMTPVAPVHWYLLTLALGSVALLRDVRLGKYITHSRSLLAWAAAFTFIMAISFVVSVPGRLADDDPLQTLISKQEMVLLLIMFTLIYQARAALEVTTKLLVLVTLISTIINLAEFTIAGIEFSSVAGRSAGLYVDSNLSGTMLVAGMLLSTLRVPTRFRIAYCVFVGIGVLVTFSRSALLLWTAAFIGMLAFGWLTIYRKAAVATAIIGLVMAAHAMNTGGWVSAFEMAGAGDLLTTNTRARIGDSFLDQQDFSKAEREAVALRAFDEWRKAPILGNGIGYSGRYPVRSHNQYLDVASDMGTVGLIAVMALLTLLWCSGTEVGILFGNHLFISNFFSHNNLEFAAVQIAIALALSTSWKDVARLKLSLGFSGAARPA